MATILHPRIKISITSVPDAEYSSLLLDNKEVSEKDVINQIIHQFERLLAKATDDLDGDRVIIIEGALELGDLLRKSSKFHSCLNLLQWCVALCDQFAKLQMKLKMIRECGRAIWICALFMKKKKQNLSSQIQHLAFPLLEELLKKLEQVQTDELKALTESWCLYFYAACHHYSGKHKLVHKYSKMAITLMRDTFKEEYTKYRVVGLSHAISAVAHESVTEYTAAIAEYKNAIKAFENAIDMNELYKKSCINHEKSKVSHLRRALWFSSLSFSKN